MSSEPKRGRVFRHKHFLDGYPGDKPGQPMVMIITKVERGEVYYKAAEWNDTRWVAVGGGWRSPVENFEQKRVLEWVE